MAKSSNSEESIRSLHLVGNHLTFSSLTFAMKRVDYLSGAERDGALVVKLDCLNDRRKLINFISRALQVWKYKGEINQKIKDGVNLIHIYCMWDLVLVLFATSFNSQVAICLSIYNMKFNKVQVYILKGFIRRVDQFFVSSRFIIDQLWSMFKIPPSRCTVLAITKYLEKKDIELVPIKRDDQNKKLIKIGCYLGSPQEIGKYVRFKAMLNSGFALDQVKYQFFLIRNAVNNSFIPKDGIFGNVRSEVADDIDLTNLDFWLVFSDSSPCPFINDALKIGAIVIAPSTHYTAELQRILKDKLFTYKAREISSLSRILRSQVSRIISCSYAKQGLSGSSWTHERNYLVEGYQKATRRREHRYRISSQ